MNKFIILLLAVLLLASASARGGRSGGKGPGQRERPERKDRCRPEPTEEMVAFVACLESCSSSELGDRAKRASRQYAASIFRSQDEDESSPEEQSIKEAIFDFTTCSCSTEQEAAVSSLPTKEEVEAYCETTQEEPEGETEEETLPEEEPEETSANVSP